MNELYLASTYKLLKDTFDDELPEKYYQPVMILMFEGLCEENLIKSIGSFHNIGQGKVDVEYLDIVYNAANIEKIKKTKEYEEAFSMLKANGYLEWLEEED